MVSCVTYNTTPSPSALWIAMRWNRRWSSSKVLCLVVKASLVLSVTYRYHHQQTTHILQDGSSASYQRQPVVAVVGAAGSQVSVMVASMLQLFKVRLEFVTPVV